MNSIDLLMTSPIRAQNAGLFISRGTAPHPTRTIDSHELIFVKQGYLNLWEGEQQFQIKAGECLHLFPNRQHGSHEIMQSDLKFYWIHFDIDTASTESVRFDGYQHNFKIPQVQRVQRPEKLEHLFRLFLEEQETGTLQPISANLFTMLMLHEVSLSKNDPVHVEDGSTIAIGAHTYIRINFDLNLTAGSVASAMGYNPDYLGRLYKRTYGITLTEAIHRRRVEVACNLLLDTNQTITAIASQCGYSDPDYFRRIFRRITEMNPGDYRVTYARIHVNTH